MVHRDRAAGRGPGAGRRSATRPPAVAGDLAGHRTRLHEVIRPVVESAGYDLEDLSVLYVLLDLAFEIDAVADLSRDISVALDAAEETGGDFGSGEYVLEVSSPGVDRPLSQPRHWRRNIGRLVEVPVGDGKITGRLVEAGDAGIVLDVNGTRRGYPYAEVGPGRVQLEFGRLEEPDDGDLPEDEDLSDEDLSDDDVEEDGE